MKVSYNWLNEYLDGKAPKVQKLAELLDDYSMEVESTVEVGKDYVIDAKATPNLNHSCLCHRGIAREVATIIDMKPKKYSRNFKEFSVSKTSKNIEVEIEDPKLCRRYIGRVVENIKVGPSPQWLREKLETLGQRSINNVVDATNFVMLEIGQPMHAFDADKLGSDKIVVKNAKKGQKITTLDKKEVELDENVLLITDGENPLAIAGVKGGNYAELGPDTKNIILESANFNPVLIRKTAQKIKIATDASKRYENDLTPELCGEAMDILTKLIAEIAGTKDTKAGEAVDNYPRRANPYKLGISSKEASDIIGVEIKDKDIEKIFDRFEFEWKKNKPTDEALKLAESLLGTPYKYGASISYDSPKAFDCSAFISYIFAQSGVQIPRMSVDQYVFSQKIGKENIIPGDIVFSNTGDMKRKIDFESIEFLPKTKIPEGVDHCGIYFGEGKIIHCSESKGGVVKEELDKSEKFQNIIGYGRMSDNKERFVITVPPERLDLRIKEDLAEEIGRIFGYEKIKDNQLPKIESKPGIDKAYAYKQKIMETLYGEGFSEVMNYTFRGKGKIELENSMSPERRYLRENLTDGIKDTLEHNVRFTELIDTPQVKVFEFGHVFSDNGESENFVIGVKNPVGVKKPKEKEVLDDVLKKLSDKLGLNLKRINSDENISEFIFAETFEDAPEINHYDFIEAEDSRLKYKKFSQYPFVIRDIAVFTPEGTSTEDVFEIIKGEMTDLVVKSRLFDVFTKEIEGTKKISYAYRIVFQSYERTLSDDEVNAIMEKITKKLNAKSGWTVR